MKTFVLTCSLFAALVIPAFAQARDVTFTTELQNYGGDGAYLALYLTDAAGEYQGTLWVSGKKSKYYHTLGGWARGRAVGVWGAGVGGPGKRGKSEETKDETRDEKRYVQYSA